MYVSILEFFILILYMCIFLFCIFTQNGVHALIISELIWILIFCIYLFSGLFFESNILIACTLFIIVLAAVDVSIWIFILNIHSCFDKFLDSSWQLNTLKFFLRARRLLYLNKYLL